MRAVLGAFAERGVPMVVDTAYAVDGVTVRLDGWNAALDCHCLGRHDDQLLAGGWAAPGDCLVAPWD